MHADGLPANSALIAVDAVSKLSLEESYHHHSPVSAVFIGSSLLVLKHQLCAFA